MHTGEAAAASAHQLNARAFTLGRDIVFGEGQYDPGTHAGRRLLAHELAHVVQQTGLSGRSSFGEGILQAAFEDEPISAGSNSDTLVTRIQGILREWKSECQEGVNDFVHAELAARIDTLGSGSWPGFVTALIGNTIWAASAFVPLVFVAVPEIAVATFAMSMLGVAINASPSIPSASSEGENLSRIALLLKNYFGEVFTGLMDQINPRVQRYVRNHPTQTGNQALIAFLAHNFLPTAVNLSGTPNINGNEIRAITHRIAADLLNRYRQQVVPIGPITTVNRTDPVDRQVSTQTGLVWARHNNGISYLTLIYITNEAIGGRQSGTRIRFLRFIDNDLKQSAIERATPNQPRGIQTLPWDAVRDIPGSATATAARRQ